MRKIDKRQSNLFHMDEYTDEGYLPRDIYNEDNNEHKLWILLSKLKWGNAEQPIYVRSHRIFLGEKELNKNKLLADLNYCFDNDYKQINVISIFEYTSEEGEYNIIYCSNITNKYIDTFAIGYAFSAITKCYYRNYSNPDCLNKIKELYGK